MAWYADATAKTAFFDVLNAAGVLEDIEDAKSYMKKPFQYDAEYKEWAAAGFPGSDDPAWDEFIEALEALSENSESSDDDDDDDDDDDEDDDTPEGA